MTTFLSAQASGAAQTVAATGAASYAWLLILIPLASAGLLLLLGRTSDKWGHLLATLASWSTFVIGAAIAAQMWGAPEDARRFGETLFTWIPAGDLTVNFGLLVDPLSITFVILVTFVGSLIHVYAIAYMEHDEARRRFFAYLNFFIAAMLTLVLADSYAGLFAGWEGVGLASYLLIGFWNHVPAYAVAAKKAFVMNRVGDMGMLIAMMGMVASFQSVSFSEVSARAGSIPTASATFIGFFLLVAACGKSAQFPLQAWLGDAMAGPTPVSALIHAATMVTAGVYLIVRSGAVFVAAPVRRYRRRHHRRDHAPLRRDRRLCEGRHEEGPRRLHHEPDRLHDAGRGPGSHRLGVRDLPPLHPRLLQGPHVPRCRFRHARHG